MRVFFNLILFYFFYLKNFDNYISHDSAKSMAVKLFPLCAAVKIVSENWVIRVHAAL